MEIPLFQQETHLQMVDFPMAMLDYRSVTSLAFLSFFGCILKDSETPKQSVKSTNMSVMISSKLFRKSTGKS